MTFDKVDIVGAGNVACHLIRAFDHAGIHVHQVFHRDAAKAADAASLVNARHGLLKDATAEGPLIILAVSDDAISEVSEQLPPERTVVHMSGTVSIDALVQSERGVFYPLQTFTRDVTPDWKRIPFCIESSAFALTKNLCNLAATLSENVYTIDSAQRKWIHVAAVFVNNFTNLLYTEAHDLLKKHDLPFDLLRPLIDETARKVQQQSPDGLQTGPARRGDIETINRHLDQLSDDADLRELYRTLTERIIQRYA